jgi:hypothetical protein
MAASIYSTVQSGAAAVAARPYLTNRAAARRAELDKLAPNKAAISALLGAEVVELPATGTLDKAYRQAGGELINVDSPSEYQWVSPTGIHRRLAAGLSSMTDAARWESLRKERLQGRWIRVSGGDWPGDADLWGRPCGFEVELRLRTDGGLDARRAVVAVRSREGAEWTWFLAPEGAKNSPLDRQVADLATRTTLVAKYATRYPDTDGENFLSVELLDGQGWVTYSRDFNSWSMYQKSGRGVLQPDFVRLAFAN